MEHDKAPRASGVARHVCADGCQFLIEKGALARGESLSFALDGHGVIRGRVQWVVRNRIGMAFDRALQRDTAVALAARGRVARTIDLVTRG